MHLWIETPNLLALADAFSRLGMELALNCRRFRHTLVSSQVLPDWLALGASHGQDQRMLRADHCARLLAWQLESLPAPPNEVGVFECPDGSHACLVDLGGPGGEALAEVVGSEGEKLKLAYALSVPDAVAEQLGWTVGDVVVTGHDGSVFHVYLKADSMKKMKVTISPTGEVKAEMLEGCVGAECEQVMDGLHRALGGKTLERVLKPEFYQEVAQTQQESVAQGGAG